MFKKSVFPCEGPGREGWVGLLPGFLKEGVNKTAPDGKSFRGAGREEDLLRGCEIRERRRRTCRELSCGEGG